MKMASYKESDCVGCPQGCINCGRREGYMVYVCDFCGEESTDTDFLQRVNGKEICSKCLRAIDGEEKEDE